MAHELPIDRRGNEPPTPQTGYNSQTGGGKQSPNGQDSKEKKECQIRNTSGFFTTSDDHFPHTESSWGQHGDNNRKKLKEVQEKKWYGCNAKGIWARCLIASKRKGKKEGGEGVQGEQG